MHTKRYSPAGITLAVILACYIGSIIVLRFSSSDRAIGIGAAVVCVLLGLCFLVLSLSHMRIPPFILLILISATRLQGGETIPGDRSWFTYSTNKTYEFRVKDAEVLRTPVWAEDSEHPALSSRRALLSAKSALAEIVDTPSAWKLDGISLEPWDENGHWIYIVTFRHSTTSLSDGTMFKGRLISVSTRPAMVSIPVLLNGVAVKPSVTLRKTKETSDSNWDNIGSPLFANDTSTNALPNYVGAPESVPVEHISPEEVVQDSIQMLRLWTNSFIVRWTYTEAGAEKMLAFREAHWAEKVRMVIGDFQRLITISKFRPMPPTFTNYAQWKEGWLKRRTDKFYSLNEDEAKLIMSGLKSK